MGQALAGNVVVHDVFGIHVHDREAQVEALEVEEGGGLQHKQSNV